MLMKKLYYLLFIVTITFISSCTHEEEDLFSASSAKRADATIKANISTLTSAKQGWLMEYYPESKQSYGGFNIFLSFGTDGKAKVESELFDPDKSATSLYSIKQSAGTVLSFDTYNEIIHLFSDPSDPANVGKEGYGLEGDFDFLILEATAEKIVLKGKKTGNYATLKPMVDTPSDYFKKVAEIEAKLNAPLYCLNIGGEKLECALNYRVLSYNYTDSNGNIISKKIGYCCTATGIRLYSPIEINNVSVQEFTLNGNKLVSDNKVVIDFIYPIFTGKTSIYLWGFNIISDKFYMSETVKAWIIDTDKANQATLGETLSSIRFDPNKGNPAIVFTSKTNKSAYNSYFIYNLSIVNFSTNKIKFSNKYTLGTNASFYPHFGLLVSKILNEGTYILEADDPSKPTQIKFTSEKNPDIWFYVFLYT